MRRTGYPAYREVISKVVPKIWARTNSAIFADRLMAGEVKGSDGRRKYVLEGADKGGVVWCSAAIQQRLV
jgi:hypothetical protein